jgi:hypothetical protein
MKNDFKTDELTQALFSYNGAIINWLEVVITRGTDAKPPIPPPPPIKLGDLIDLRGIMEEYQKILSGLR